MFNWSCYANTAKRFSPNREMWSSTFTDPAGRPSFNALQNYGSSATPLVYYVFDVLILAGEDVTSEQLVRRRALLQAGVLSKLDEPIRESPILDASLPDLIRSVKAQGLEGIVAKRLDSRYEPGLRSGMWQKMRVNQGQQFVIGGYTASAKNFDALIFGYHKDTQLVCAARTRNGFTPASREKLFRQFKGMEISQCPFANLPEAKSGRWGQGLTAEKMKDCRWPRSELVGQSRISRMGRPTIISGTRASLAFAKTRSRRM